VIYVDGKQLAELRLLSKQTKIPASAIARDGIDMALKKYKQIAKKLS
jgi:hypothetical protein